MHTPHSRYEAPSPGAEDPGSEVSAKMSLFGMQTDVRYMVGASGAAFRVAFDRSQFEQVGLCLALQPFVCCKAKYSVRMHCLPLPPPSSALCLLISEATGNKGCNGEQNLQDGRQWPHYIQDK
jgi:hypothetical protein